MLINLNNVRFSYSNSSSGPVLDIPQWSIEKHEHTFLHGPSGVGKSTLLNILSGVLTGYEGDVEILSQSLSQMSTRQRDRFRAAHIGYVFQQFNLIPFLSATENIQLAKQFAKRHQKNNAIEDVKQLLSSLSISSNDTDKPVSQLSIGQQQRIAIARALVNQPELIIADEPTSSLDAANRDRFISILMEHAEETGATLLFVSHDESLSRHFQRVEAIKDISQVREG